MRWNVATHCLAYDGLPIDNPLKIRSDLNCDLGCWKQLLYLNPCPNNLHLTFTSSRKNVGLAPFERSHQPIYCLAVSEEIIWQQSALTVATDDVVKKNVLTSSKRRRASTSVDLFFVFCVSTKENVF